MIRRWVSIVRSEAASLQLAAYQVHECQVGILLLSGHLRVHLVLGALHQLRPVQLLLFVERDDNGVPLREGRKPPRLIFVTSDRKLEAREAGCGR